MLQIGRSLVRSELMSVDFSLTKSFRSHHGPGVDSACNRNEYQEYFLGGKVGQCVRLTTYHHPVPLSRNLGTLTSWNPLGHSRPVTGLLYLFTPPTPKLLGNNYKFMCPGTQSNFAASHTQGRQIKGLTPVFRLILNGHQP